MKILGNVLSKITGVVLATGFLLMNYTSAFCEFRSLPNTIYVKAGQDFSLPAKGPFEIHTENAAFVGLNNGETLKDVVASNTPATIKVSLFGLIPIKNIDVHVREETWVIPGGQTIGVSLYTQGALVVGTVEIEGEDGISISPAAAVGIKPGDYIIGLGNVSIETAEDLMKQQLGSEPMEITLERNGEILRTTIQPIRDLRDGEFHLGIWVRDSTMGIGTLSFCDATLGWYGGLGHAIIDIDTNTRLSVRNGNIVEAEIIDIVPGEEGNPGELRGSFHSGSMVYGDIRKNTEYGIYGKISCPIPNDLYPSGIQVAYHEEVHEGSAEILSTLGDEQVHSFSCEIIKVHPQSVPEPKGLVIEVTDPLLLKKTGGIVQGMSGSPIIQDGKLVGAVTHVLVNDPTRGYGIFIENMLEAAG